MKISEKITEIRKENNLTQEEFAEKLFVTRQTVSNWENTKSYPDIETLILISDKFKCSLDILLREDREMVRTIDKIKKANRLSKRIIAIISIFTFALIIASYIFLKLIFLDIYKIENKSILDNYVNNIKKINLEPTNEKTNMSHEGLAIKIPDNFKKIENEDEVYHIKIDNIDCNTKTLDIFAPKEYLESIIVKVPNNEVQYGMEAKRLISIFKSTNFEKNWAFHKRFNPLIFNYKKLMKKYGVEKERDLIDYYKKHANDKLNIFSRLSHIQMNNMAATYVEDYFSTSKENEIASYKFMLGQLNIFVKTNGNYFVALLYKDNDLYNITFNKDYFNIDKVIEVIKSIKIKD